MHARTHARPHARTHARSGGVYDTSPAQFAFFLIQLVYLAALLLGVLTSLADHSDPPLITLSATKDIPLSAVVISVPIMAMSVPIMAIRVPIMATRVPIMSIRVPIMEIRVPTYPHGAPTAQHAPAVGH